MRKRGAAHLVNAVVALALLAPTAGAQELADYDYENLTFRGFAPEWGYILPTRVEPTQSFGLRLDLGYLGPGVRVVPSVTYWASTLKRGEVEKLESQLATLVTRQTGDPAPTLDLGTIAWSAVAVAVDAQVVWRVPYGFLTFAGLGVGTHALNGSGPAIDGTFVEDLLDSVAAGFNVHAGLEYPVRERFRVYGQGRYEVMGDLQYAQIRLGGQFMVRRSAPGEEGSR